MGYLVVMGFRVIGFIHGVGSICCVMVSYGRVIVVVIRVGVGEVVWLDWFWFCFLGPCPLWLVGLVYARLSWFAYLQIYY